MNIDTINIVKMLPEFVEVILEWHYGRMMIEWAK